MLGVLALVLALSAPAPAAAEEPVAASRIVVLRDGVDSRAAIHRLQASLGFRARHGYRPALTGFAAGLTGAQVARLRADAAVAFVAPDAEVRASAVPIAAGETVPAGVRRVQAATTTAAHAASDVAVAVLDTGLDLASPDLAAVTGTNCVEPGTAAQDDHGHGTHVAGTLAGANTGAGVVGVAPGTTLYAVKVLGARGTGALSQLLCGIDWVASNARRLGIRVANLSVNAAGTNDGACGTTNGDAQHRAICAAVDAGVTWVVSAGNSAADFARSIPAAYPEVLTVAAMADTDGAPGGVGPAPCMKGERDDAAASWSSYAVSAADAAHALAAPGVCVLSSRRGGGTSTMSGTSTAAPHVAGVAALCFGSAGVPGPCAGLRPAQVIQRLRVDAAAAGLAGFGFAGDPLRPLAGRVFGHLASAAAY